MTTETDLINAVKSLSKPQLQKIVTEVAGRLLVTYEGKIDPDKPVDGADFINEVTTIFDTAGLWPSTGEKE